MLLTRYLVLSLLPSSALIDEWLASDLFFHFHSAIDVWFLWIAFDLPIILGTPILLLLLRKKLFVRQGSRIGLCGPAVALCWLFILAHHFLLDIQPVIAATALPLLVFTQPRAWKKWKLPPASLSFGATVIACGICVQQETSLLGATAGMTLLILLALAGRILNQKLLPHLQWIIAILLILFAQSIVSIVPLSKTPEHATRIDTHRAYSFCESSNGTSIYAAVTACFLHDSRFLVSEDCKQEHVVEFDAQTLRLKNRHILSSPDYYGRMEFIRCIEDTLFVGGSDMIQDGENLLDSALSFKMGHPEAVTRNLVRPGVGHRSAYDPKRDAIYFSGEFSDQIIRLDRQSGATFDEVANWYKHPMLALFLFPIPGSLAFAPNSYHPGRDALYAGEVFSDAAFGFNLADHSLIQKYQGTGGITELTVDPEQDKLYLANMWGMDIYNLKTGAREKRLKLGTVNRHPIIDERRNMIYVPSTVTGRLYVVNRKTFEVLGSIHTGYGLRYGLLTRDGKQLIISTNSGTFSFDVDSLNRQILNGEAG